MPELPEVEVITQGLRQHIIGRKITSIWCSGKKLRVPLPFADISEKTVGKIICGVTRRAKYVQIILNTGSLLAVHLGMTGNLGLFKDENQRAKHDHLEWELDDGTFLRFNDSRRFGSIRIFSKEDATTTEQTIYKNIGPEPFSEFFSTTYLYQLAKGRSTTVKQFLMTSNVVAGIGNIYANESLFRAGINPARKVTTLSKKEWSRLVDTVQQVLTHAIECGGSTINDFLSASQERGYFQMNFKVYGKAGEQCLGCDTTIAKRIIGGRASFFCPRCQK